jgi:hypothetical protein
MVYVEPSREPVEGREPGRLPCVLHHAPGTPPDALHGRCACLERNALALEVEAEEREPVLRCLPGKMRDKLMGVPSHSRPLRESGLNIDANVHGL